MSQYSVTWEAYQQSICKGLVSLQQRGDMVDMTLAADGHHVKVHQLVMCLVSPYIQELITSAHCPHPVIFLNKISFQTLNSILQYAYTGEVVVANDKIHEFFIACKELHIRGMENTANPVEAAHSKPVEHSVEEIEQQTFDDDFDTHCDDDDTDMMTSTRVDKEPVTETLPQKKAQVKDYSAATLQYTMSNMGGVQVALNRYIYNWRSSRKNGEKMWRCKDFLKKKCRALVRSKDDVVLSRAGAHNHPFHDETILKKVHRQNMFTTLREVQELINLRQTIKQDNDQDVEAKQERKPMNKPIIIKRDQKSSRKRIGVTPMTEHNKALEAYLASRNESMPKLED